MDFGSIFPSLGPWVANLNQVWPGSMVADSVWMYAVFGASHLLFLALLGGCVILLNLRLMGAGMTSEKPSLLEQQLRPWFIAGVIGILFTGIIIGWSNAEKLYYSPSFFVKMMSLAAALIFSFGVTNKIARQEGKITLGLGGQIAAWIAFTLWLWALGVFTSVEGTNPGAIHIITAGYLILMAYGKNTRIPAIIGLIASVLAVFFHAYLGMGMLDNFDGFIMMNIVGVKISALLLVILMGYELFVAKRDTDTSALVKLIALFSILSWVTVAAAGRWIGLS